MARLLPLLAFLVIGLVLVLLRQDATVRPRDGRTYRPRGRARDRGGRSDAGVTLLRRRDLAGLRDAYSGEPLDPSRPLLTCGHCQSVYHADSAGVLARDNGGRCASCGATDFSAVKVIAD
jgi:hypothetical protein